MPKPRERTAKRRRKITHRRFTVIEKVAILEKLRTGISVPDVAKEFGRSDAAVYRIKADEIKRSGTCQSVDADADAGAGAGGGVTELHSSEGRLDKMEDKNCNGHQEPCAITFPMIKEEVKWDPEELEALASSYMGFSDVCSEAAQSQPSDEASWQHSPNFDVADDDVIDVIDLTREESQRETMVAVKQVKLQHVGTEAKNESTIVYSNPNEICKKVPSEKKDLVSGRKSASKKTLKWSVFHVNSEGKFEALSKNVAVQVESSHSVEVGESSVKKEVVGQEIADSKQKSCSCANERELCFLHPNRRRYFCSLCGAMFLWKDYLDKHMTSHAIDMPYSCSICSLKFRLRESLEKHMRFHPGCKSASCIVGSKWKSRPDTQTALDAVGPQFGCAICQMRFVLKDQLRSHLVVHQDRKLFCGTCEAQFSLEEELFQHVEAHFNKTLGQYTCSVCSTVLTSQQHLDSHMSTHYTKETFSCSSCTMSFTSSKLLEYHMVFCRSRSGQGLLGSSMEIQPFSGVIIYHHGASVSSCSQIVADSMEGQSISSHVSSLPDNQNKRVPKTSGVTVFKNFFGQHKKNRQNSDILGNYEETHNSSTNTSETQGSSVGNQHMKVQQLAKKLSCFLCNAKFTQQCTLDNHMKISHSLKCTRRKGKT